MVSSISPRQLFRQMWLFVNVIWRILQRCSFTLLNDQPVWYRLWTVAVGAAPVVLWTVSFKKAKFIPLEWRPTIHIHAVPKINSLIMDGFVGTAFLTLLMLPIARLVLKRCEGGTPSGEPNRGRFFACLIVLYPIGLKLAHELGRLPISSTLDVAAFVTYGALHFASPIVGAWMVWGFGTQGSAKYFGWCLGLQNCCGLITHLLVPVAAPWFYDVYGASPAQPDYTYPGNAAGLVRVDDILGTNLYRDAFKKHGAVVFGAVPSLHSATAFCCCLFALRYHKGARGLWACVYLIWMSWSTIYFHHHFVLDLVVGAAYSATAFYVVDRVWLRANDARHYELALTNGWDRLRWGKRDGGPVLGSDSDSGFGEGGARTPLMGSSDGEGGWRDGEEMMMDEVERMLGEDEREKEKGRKWARRVDQGRGEEGEKDIPAIRVEEVEDMA